MTTYVWRNGELVDKRVAPPVFQRGERSFDVPLPNFIPDKLWDLKSMADGKLYDSKSELRRSYREQGYEELGNDAPTENAPVERPNVKPDLIDAMRKVKAGYKPAPLEQAALADDGGYDVIPEAV